MAVRTQKCKFEICVFTAVGGINVAHVELGGRNAQSYEHPTRHPPVPPFFKVACPCVRAAPTSDVRHLFHSEGGLEKRNVLAYNNRITAATLKKGGTGGNQDDDSDCAFPLCMALNMCNISSTHRSFSFLSLDISSYSLLGPSW